MNPIQVTMHSNSGQSNGLNFTVYYIPDFQCTAPPKLHYTAPAPYSLLQYSFSRLHCTPLHCRAKIIFAGKLRYPYFCHIFGMERQFLPDPRGPA